HYRPVCPAEPPPGGRPLRLELARHADDHARHGHPRTANSAHAVRHARHARPGLHPHRVGEGARPARRPVPARPQERGDPPHHAGRCQLRLHAGRRGADRECVLVSGHRAARGPGHLPARLPAGPGGGLLRLAGGHPRQPRHRSGVRAREPPGPAPVSWRGRPWASAGAALVLLVLLAAVLAPVLSPYPPTLQDLARSQQPPAWLPGGSWENPLGTDHLGRDVLSRVIYGSRVSLVVGAGGVVLALTLGLLVGLTAGYARGWVDDLAMRLCDVQLALPYLLFVVAIVGVL